VPTTPTAMTEPKEAGQSRVFRNQTPLPSIKSDKKAGKKGRILTAQIMQRTNGR
jgi:hypothetical protein